MKKILLFSTLLIFLLGCDKFVTEHNASFEGKWRTLPQLNQAGNFYEVSQLEFAGKEGKYSGYCSNTCDSNPCDCKFNHLGKAVVNKQKTQIKIGTSGSFALDIQQEPTQDANGIWTIKVHSQIFYKL